MAVWRPVAIVATFSLLLALLGSRLVLEAVVLPEPPPLHVAGSFYRGDGLGINHTLELTAEGAFHFRWQGCLGTYSEAAGKVVQIGPLLALETTAVGIQRVASGVDGRYRPIPWGDRLYLVPTGELMAFVNDVNLGREPRYDSQGSHYLARDGWDLPAAGRPDLPPGYAELLLDQPVAGRVERRLPAAGDRLRFAIGHLQGDRLAPRMALVERRSDDSDACELRIVSAAGGAAVAEADVDDEACAALRPGAAVSTRLPGPLCGLPDGHDAGDPK